MVKNNRHFYTAAEDGSGILIRQPLFLLLFSLLYLLFDTAHGSIQLGSLPGQEFVESIVVIRDLNVVDPLGSYSTPRQIKLCHQQDGIEKTDIVKSVI